MSFVNGKIILSGEHSVVYGEMALSAAISRGVKAVVVDKASNIQNDLVRTAIEKASEGVKINIEIESELPFGSGLGSSAAISAATIMAVREYLGESISNDDLFRLTWETEKVFSPKDSGLDSTTVVYGGLIEYQKGKPFKQLLIKKPLTFLIVDSGRPSETTGELVKQVADDPDNKKIIEEIGRLTPLIKERLISGENVEAFVNQNGLLLEKLGVVGVRAKKISKILRQAGASVKITGAGGVATGSGMMIVMKDDLTQIKKLLDNSQIDYFEVTIGGK